MTTPADTMAAATAQRPRQGRLPAAVEVIDLVKRYPKRPVNAVDGVSFAVHAGEVFGLLGPNGAGKTTTIGILTTRVRATSGSATVGGVDVVTDPVGARAQLAVVPQRPNLDRSLTARQNLLFHAAYHGVSHSEREVRADRLLEAFGLGDRGADKVDRYSGGQAQRLMIARALMHSPQVLFLDEPSTGLDPQARLFVWDRVRQLRDEGTTVVLTTHDMDEASTLCDRVGIMDKGTLLALDTPDALTATLPGKATLDLRIRTSDSRAVVSSLGALDGVVLAEQVGESAGALRVRVSVQGDAPAMLGPVAALLAAQGDELIDVGLGQPSLEDVFIALTGRGLR